MKSFRTQQLAVQFYQECKHLSLPAHLKSQLLRASSSVALNLMEGRGRSSIRDQLRFFDIAMGSIRECQSILTLEPDAATLNSQQLLDHLAASAFQLIRQIRNSA